MPENVDADTTASERPSVFFFLPPFAPDQSQRRKELNRSRALGHAAAWSHAQRARVCFTGTPKRSAKGAASHTGEKSLPSKDIAKVQERPSLRPFRGNSDPFYSTPLPVTPRVAQLLEFLRSFMLPRLFNIRFPNAENARPDILSSASGALGLKTGFYQDANFDKTSIPEMLENECRGLCWSYSYLIAMNRIVSSKELADELIELRRKALQALRHLVEQDCDESSYEAMIIMYSAASLHAAAAMAHDLPEAAVHGRMVQTQWRLHPNLINPYRLFRTVWVDIMLSTIHIVTPHFDVTPGGWVDTHLLSYFKSLEPTLRARRDVLAKARRRSTVVGSTMEDVFILARLAHSIWCHPDESWTFLQFHWVSLQHLLLQGRCISFLAQLRDNEGVITDIKAGSVPGDAAPWPRLKTPCTDVNKGVQAMLATAMVALLTLFRDGEGVEYSLFRSAKSFLYPMHALLMSIYRGRSSDLEPKSIVQDGPRRRIGKLIASEFSPNRHADVDASILWTVFVGTLIEIGNAPTNGPKRRANTEDRQMLFLPTLQHCMADMGIESLTALKICLDYFIYPEGFVPKYFESFVFPSRLVENPDELGKYA